MAKAGFLLRCWAGSSCLGKPGIPELPPALAGGIGEVDSTIGFSQTF
jgi:hypothetical protein